MKSFLSLKIIFFLFACNPGSRLKKRFLFNLSSYSQDAPKTKLYAVSDGSCCGGEESDPHAVHGIEAINNEITLGHRRLAIVDINFGHQPMFDSSKRYSIIFNGEIFNERKVLTLKANKLTISAKNKPICCQGDGEIFGEGKIEYSVRKKALQFIY